MGKCSTLALMHCVLPYAMVVQLCVSPLVDPPGILQFEWTREAVFWILISGVAAFLVNFSGFLVMGNIGALAHVLLGQLKTSVICLGAYVLFDATYSNPQLISAAGAIFSIIGYTHVTLREKIDDDKLDPYPESNASIDDTETEALCVKDTLT